MRSAIDLQAWDHALLWLACLLATLGLLRAGELTVDNDLSPGEVERRLLRVRHLTFADDGTSMTLHVPVTKTAQISGMDVAYRASGDALCPIAAWRAYRAHRQSAGPDEPLLLTRARTALRKQDLVQQLRTTLRCAGITDEAALQRFSGHSFRRGGAQTLHRGGMSKADVKSAGRWKSNAVDRYLDTSAAAVASAVAPVFAVAAASAAANMMTQRHCASHCARGQQC